MIAHTEGGYLHDGVITSMTKSWLRGQASRLAAEDKPWFMAVNLVNPHDVMYYNTDLPGSIVRVSAERKARYGVLSFGPSS
jgi:arylsulfatase